MRAAVGLSAAFVLLGACVLQVSGDARIDNLLCGADGRCPEGMICNAANRCRFLSDGGGPDVCPSAPAAPEFSGDEVPVPLWLRSEPPSPTNVPSASLFGSATPGAAVFVSISGDCSMPWGQCTRADADGAFSFTISLQRNRETRFYAFAAHPYDIAKRSTCSAAIALAHDDLAPTVPGIPIATPGDGRIVLEWAAGSDPSGIAGYEVASCEACTRLEGYRTEDVGLRTLVVIDGLTPNQPYLLAVRARDRAGNVGPFGTPVQARTLP